MKKYKLTSAIKFKGIDIAEVDICKPKVKHIAAMDKVDGEISKSIALVSACTGVCAEAIEELDASDFEAIAEAIRESMGES